VPVPFGGGALWRGRPPVSGDGTDDAGPWAAVPRLDLLWAAPLGGAADRVANRRAGQHPDRAAFQHTHCFLMPSCPHCVVAADCAWPVRRRVTWRRTRRCVSPWRLGPSRPRASVLADR